jgi:hypothetical protein
MSLIDLLIEKFSTLVAIFIVLNNLKTPRCSLDRMICLFIGLRQTTQEYENHTAY